MTKETGILKELETRVNRTYRGGLLLDRYLGKDSAVDTFQPEDWISSFVEAKNKEVIPSEGITRVLAGGEEKLISEAVGKEAFGQGRTDAGVLVKFLDAGERLGIQVHPTKEYAAKVFGSSYGKTECWHILDTREGGGSVYIGFQPFVTKELWRDLFERQDVDGMLSAMHRIQVRKGDTILVTGGTPHAIGAGCFLLEIQEPSDYTMRAEKVTVAGEKLTPMQIHYGVGQEKMLDCFSYIPRTEEEIRSEFFLKKKGSMLVSYEDTPCFALDELAGEERAICLPHFVTLVVTENGGLLKVENEQFEVKRGDKYFIPAGKAFRVSGVRGLLCMPPAVGPGSKQ